MPDVWRYAKERAETVLALAEVTGDQSELPPLCDAAIATLRRWAEAESTHDEAHRLLASLERVRSSPP